MSRATASAIVHAGESHVKAYHALTTPVVQTSTYTFENTAAIMEFMQSKAAGIDPAREEYGRYGNPTQNTVERKLAVLEAAGSALLFSSGMNAITTSLLALLTAGDHAIIVRETYRRTREFATMLQKWGINISLISIDQPQELLSAITPHTCLIFFETPTNPYLRIMNLNNVVQIARENNILTVIDSTFATPINLRPLDFGIDLVIHSASKYLGGHNDILAGVAAGSEDLITRIRAMRDVLGGVSSPNDAYLLLRGIKTLDIRVHRQNENGRILAEFLEDHPAVKRVYYPGLESHPDHTLAQRYLNGFGGVVSFEVLGDFKTTGHVIDRLQIPYIGPTFGGVESIAQQQSLFISLDPQERKDSGISDSLIRYAAGIEDVSDLIADLDQALSCVSESQSAG